MSDANPADRIAPLEEKIERLAETAERCRKIIVGAKLAIAGGAVALAVTVLGLVTFNPTVLVGGLAAVIGGIVAAGSNMTTRDQTLAAIAQAEAQRAALIEGIDLRLVEAEDAEGSGRTARLLH
jgi:hypothetical protein